jgi:hypothetical protein
MFQSFKLGFLFSADILKKFNGFRKLIYGGISLTFIITTTFITGLSGGAPDMPHVLAVKGSRWSFRRWRTGRSGVHRSAHACLSYFGHNF